MRQTVDQIEEQLVSGRENLRSNLEELGQKVRSAVDWRAKFRADPGAILALAFGSGFILAKIMSGRRDHAGGRFERAADVVSTHDSRGRVLRVWDEIQNALVGVAARKVSDTLADVVPGFKDQLGSHAARGSGGNGGKRSSAVNEGDLRSVFPD